MNKEQFLAFIASLPPDAMFEPISFKVERPSIAEPWAESRFRVVERTVHHDVEFRLTFVTKYEGEFKRTNAAPEGLVYNVHRVL